ncbi:MAG: G8 domain-containing protein [Sumerlaeia bacterium]
MKTLLAFLLTLAASAVMAAPVVSNVQFAQQPSETGGSEVVVTYDLASPQGDCEVSLEVSADGGATFTIIPESVGGDIGAAISPGTGKEIVWDISQDLPGIHLPNAVVRVLADDGSCAGCLLWSDPATWGGTKPQAGDVVTIGHAMNVLLDESPPDLNGLMIEGSLVFDDQDLELTADWIMLHGTLQIGTEAHPFTHSAVLTLTGDNPDANIMGMGTVNRGIMVMGGTLSLHGAPPEVLWTKIGAHANAGASTFDLIETPDWSSGDQIAIAPTDFYGVSETERLTLTAVAGQQITTAETLATFRWGLLQYPTATGMSLTPDESIVLTPEMAGTPMVLDQRAVVANLTRNIVIQAPDDTLWQNSGYGVHVMVMGPTSFATVDGVEFRRAGQAGRLGRYPYHQHLRSYSGSGPSMLADLSGEYIRRSVVNQSANRGLVIHGTNGLLVEDNIVFDVLGHGVFTEDAVERRNTFDGNVVLKVRNPTPANALRIHERNDLFGLATGSSGFWISNPDNVLTNNIAADCQAFGYWLAFPPTPQGLCNEVAVVPNRVTFGVFDDNTAHTTRNEGIMLDGPEVAFDPGSDHGGLVQQLQYWSTDSPSGIGFTAIERFHLNRYQVWKCGNSGIWDRATVPTNTECVSADNCQRFFAGSGIDGIIQRCLVVGTSLNDSGGFRPNDAGDPTISAFATYHSTFDIQHNLALNFPLVTGKRSGVFATDDYYTRAVEKGTTRNIGNVVYNSHPGYKLTARFSNQFSYQEFASWYTLASALWDPDGQWGPAGQWFVYNTPFLIHGLTVTEVAPTPAESGGVSVPGPFYGFHGFVLHGQGGTPPQNMDFDDLMAIEVRRLDLDMNEVATWRVGAGDQPGMFLQHMRDFAAHPTGLYELDFPGDPFGITHPTNVRMTVENLMTEDDTVVVGVQFDGSIDPNVYLRYPGNGAFTVYSEVASLEAVIESVGETYWRDTTGNRVWVRLRGGTWVPPQSSDVTNDDLLYHTTFLHIAP